MYGIQIHDLNAEYVTIAREALEGISIAGIPGTFWVEYFPVLRFIPSWVPGAAFKRFAEYYKPIVDRMIQEPFEEVKKTLVRTHNRLGLLLINHHANQNDPDSPPSASRSLIYQIQEKYGGTSLYPEQERIVMESMAIAYGGECQRFSFAFT